MDKPGRSGFVLIDALVTVGLSLITASLIFPVIWQTRAIADRVGCQDRLKRISMAVLAYEREHGRLPPRSTISPEHGWFTLILPFAGEEAIVKKIRFDLPYYDPANKEAIGTHLSVMQCPATPSPGRTVAGTTGGKNWTASAGDYAGNGGVFPNVMEMGILPPETDRWTVFANESIRAPLRLADIVDGQSNTLLVTEMAGRNEAWFAGTRDKEHPQDATRGPWAAPNHFEVRGHSRDGRTYPGLCAVNCSNFSGIYGFHPDGANVAACDGSVHFIHKDMNIMILYALCTHAGGEIMTASDW